MRLMRRIELKLYFCFLLGYLKLSVFCPAVSNPVLFYFILFLLSQKVKKMK